MPSITVSQAPLLIDVIPVVGCLEDPALDAIEGFVAREGCLSPRLQAGDLDQLIGARGGQALDSWHRDFLIPLVRPAG